MKDLREGGTNACIVGRIVKMKWPGHLVRMIEGDYRKYLGRRRTGRLQKARKNTGNMGGLSEGR